MNISGRNLPTRKIRQGVTTEVLGQDGLGAAPVGARSLQIVKDLLAGLDGIIPDEQWSWRSFPEYLEALEKRGLNNNVKGSAVPRSGPDLCPRHGGAGATPAELQNMRSLVRESMEEGLSAFPQD